MPSTHLSLNYHIIFSTKERRNTIEKRLQPRLFSYLGGCVKTLEGMPLCIGGVTDHVHLLIGLKATHALSEILREVKQSSSKWFHKELKIWDFSWQEGYGAFTVSPPAVPQVRRYIERQEAHHKKQSFQEEYVGLLEKAGVEFDPKFLW